MSQTQLHWGLVLGAESLTEPSASTQKPRIVDILINRKVDTALKIVRRLRPSPGNILTIFARIFVPMKRRFVSWRRGTKRLHRATSAGKDVDMTEANGIGAIDKSHHTPELSASQQDYENRKLEILGTETKEAWDRKARDAASSAQREAALIIWKIREDERDNLYGNKASEAIPDDDTLDMGGQFLTNKLRTEAKSQLYKIARKLPKGGHLHIHFNAELVPDVLIRKASQNPNMFIRSTRRLLNDKDFELAEMVFNVLPLSTIEADLFSPQYNPEAKAPGAQPWMKWSKFKDRFESTRNQNAVDWILSKMILREDEVYGSTQTTNGIWARFNQATRCFKGLFSYESVYRWYIQAAINNMICDKVMYAELRPMLMDKFIPTDDGEDKLDHKQQMQIIIDEVKKKQDQLSKDEELHKFPFGLKIIYCAPRSIPKSMMQQEIRDCIKLKQSFPDLICGFDLVGAEDRPNHIGYYRDELLAMVDRCKELNIEIPFMFHAGETLLDTGGSKDPANSNLYDAVLLNAKRIGHGFSLLKHPVLVEAFKKQDICIELCPTSNELLHLCRNIKEHPYPEILATGIPCTVNSDNPSLFSNSVSHEFYQIMVGSPAMSLHGWRQLADWSIKYSCLSDAEKTQGLQILADKWEVFCQMVIDTYGEQARALDIPGSPDL